MIVPVHYVETQAHSRILDSIQLRIDEKEWTFQNWLHNCSINSFDLGGDEHYYWRNQKQMLWSIEIGMILAW